MAMLLDRPDTDTDASLPDEGVFPAWAVIIDPDGNPIVGTRRVCELYRREGALFLVHPLRWDGPISAMRYVDFHRDDGELVRRHATPRSQLRASERMDIRGGLM